jgi:hypothetical protein
MSYNIKFWNYNNKINSSCIVDLTFGTQFPKYRSRSQSCSVPTKKGQTNYYPGHSTCPLAFIIVPICNPWNTLGRISWDENVSERSMFRSLENPHSDQGCAHRIQGQVTFISVKHKKWKTTGGVKTQFPLSIIWLLSLVMASWLFTGFVLANAVSWPCSICFAVQMDVWEQFSTAWDLQKYLLKDQPKALNS